MTQENRRQVDNIRSIIRDIVASGSLIGIVGLVFYAGKLVERFDNSITAQHLINIQQDKFNNVTARDLQILIQREVARSQKPFDDDDKDTK